MLAAVLGWVLPCQSTLKSLHKMQIDLEWVWRAVYLNLSKKSSENDQTLNFKVEFDHKTAEDVLTNHDSTQRYVINNFPKD